VHRLVLAIALLIALSSTAWAMDGSPAIGGTVTDQTGARLPGATVDLHLASGVIAATVTTDLQGQYQFDVVKPGVYSIEISLPNFARVRRTGVNVENGGTRTVDAALRLNLSADVTVTGKRTFSNLADVEDPGDLIGAADSATQGVVTARQIDSRPIMRAGEVLETVPGLIISQHSGEGKANQYYLRGFNLDHGTDFATTVAGVPVNMPTHAHGHGYSDVNFLIPELVTAVQFNKGPYSAEEGDFSTAGASHIRYANRLERPIVRASAGEDGWGRMLAAASPRIGSGHLLAALEVGHNDGPWVRPDDYQKVNGVFRYSLGDHRSALSITGMGYAASWDSTDQAPDRAIGSGALDRFAGIDDTDGGRTARYSLSADWQRSTTAGVTRATAYGLSYRLNLFSNFTYFLDHPEEGDQFEQADRRQVYGGRVSHRQVGRLGEMASELVVGSDLRYDDINTVGLYHTVSRVREATTRQDAVGQGSVGIFAQHELQLTPWLRSNLGLRGDWYHFRVEAGDPRNAGTDTDGLVSPKASLVFGPWKSTELYANWGYGFHSNDARGTTITIDPVSGEPADRVTPLVRARGEELGVRTTAVRGLQMTVALWRLDLDSELLFIGDAGTTEAGRPSRRYGIEWSTYYAPKSWLTFDADVALSDARFRDDDPVGDHIPGAVEQVLAAGVAVEDAGRVFGSLRLRYFGARALVEDGSIRSKPTTLVNGQLGVRLTRSLRVGLDVFNLFNTEASDIDYFYTSRLRGEPAGGIDDIHLHPALPRSIRIGLQVEF
jgi:outer membrane receptor protein involved in Fe transport